MLTHLRPALLLLALLSLLTGAIYPLSVTVLSQALAPAQSQGSLIRVNGTVVGSALLGQAFTAPGYLHPRPSAGDYATLPSAASNLAPTNAALLKAVAARVAAWQAETGTTPPIDAVTTSGSGLDPDVSPDTALAQADRIARARGVSADAVAQIIAAHRKGPWLGLFGQARVNVLETNLALDAALPPGPAAPKP